MNLHLTIVCGVNLEIGDIYTSDPYVVFSVNKQTYKTNTIKSTLDPVWNKSFDFQVTPGTSIEFRIFDYNTIGSDDFLGNCFWYVPQMRTSEKRKEILKVKEKGFFYFDVDCVSGQNVAPNNVITREDKMLLELNFEEIYGFAESFFKKYNKYTTKNITFTVGVSTPLTPKQYLISKSGNDKSDLTKTSFDQALRVEARVGDQITFELCSKVGRDKLDVLGCSTFTVPDLLPNEAFEVSTAVEESGMIRMIMTCLRSVYQNMDVQLIPKVPNFQGNFNIIIEKLEKVIMKGYFYCVVEIKDLVYKTAYLQPINGTVTWNQFGIAEFEDGDLCRCSIFEKNPQLVTRKGDKKGESKVRLNAMECTGMAVVPIEDFGELTLRFERNRSVNDEYYQICDQTVNNSGLIENVTEIEIQQPTVDEGVDDNVNINQLNGETFEQIDIEPNDKFTKVEDAYKKEVEQEEMIKSIKETEIKEITRKLQTLDNKDLLVVSAAQQQNVTPPQIEPKNECVMYDFTHEEPPQQEQQEHEKYQELVPPILPPPRKTQQNTTILTEENTQQTLQSVTNLDGTKDDTIESNLAPVLPSKPKRLSQNKNIHPLNNDEIDQTKEKPTELTQQITQIDETPKININVDELECKLEDVVPVLPPKPRRLSQNKGKTIPKMEEEVSKVEKQDEEKHDPIVTPITLKDDQKEISQKEKQIEALPLVQQHEESIQKELPKQENNSSPNVTTQQQALQINVTTKTEPTVSKETEHKQHDVKPVNLRPKEQRKPVSTPAHPQTQQRKTVKSTIIEPSLKQETNAKMTFSQTIQKEEKSCESPKGKHRVVPTAQTSQQQENVELLSFKDRFVMFEKLTKDTDSKQVKTSNANDMSQKMVAVSKVATQSATLLQQQTAKTTPLPSNTTEQKKKTPPQLPKRKAPPPLPQRGSKPSGGKVGPSGQKRRPPPKDISMKDFK
ncbi:hypothetical protein EIN_397230 [Entamoeba invadens IP1]|uniref:C2 domain-containing protein n=1 Tax=Entamoeba invadens IP1 TaxID=370355 RepID=A0A0A1U9W3_ENTIV|nr:hypothetical protein EIN_397230 [Entamoeba invadens IP1]ELP91853.1 hypothetical protein EIN_397230 [Entamoeba invadens IP1]|eukprot:XP_004258624.1 hypothetical protein EIN_397230 [Entamoeba invadens IP1]